LSESRSLQRVIVPLEDLHVGSNPLSNNNCKERCQETAYETGEPVRAHSNVGK
jgi:hypothetical protein